MTIADIKKTPKPRWTSPSRPQEQPPRSAPAVPTGAAGHHHVEYYGSMVPLSQVANVSCWMRAPSACSPGKRTWRQDRKAIRESDLGLNPPPWAT
jgi:ribosome recycling factor